MNEVENSFRILKGDTPLATGRFCWLGWHKWTKYGNPKIRVEGVRQVDYQLRECTHCGLINVKQLRRF